MSRLVFVPAIISALSISVAACSDDDDRIAYGDTQEFTKRMTAMGAKCEITGDIFCSFEMANDLKFLTSMGTHGGLTMSFDRESLKDSSVYLKYGEVAAMLPYGDSTADKVFKVPAELSSLCREHGHIAQTSKDMTMCSLNIVMTDDGKIERNITKESVESLEGIDLDDPSTIKIPQPPTSGTVVNVVEYSGKLNQLTFGWIDASRIR